MIKKLPLVTIAIAAHNGEKFISEAIKSVLCQNYANFKIIISDDCSSDETQKICRSHADKDHRIKYLRQPKNIGPINNYYFLYKNAEVNSKYFKFLDQDDWLVGVSFLSSLIKSLEDGYDFGISNVTIRHYDKENFNDKHNTNSIFENCHSNYDYSKAVIDQASMTFYSVFNLRSFGRYFEKYYYIKHQEDSGTVFLEGSLNLVIACELKAKYIGSESFVYQIHGENLSQTSKVVDLIKDYKLYLKYSIKYIIFESNFNVFQKISLFILLIKRIKHLVLRLYGSLIKSKFKLLFS
jgi:glycosyltransferase involved in cell wall biosynthesis